MTDIPATGVVAEAPAGAAPRAASTAPSLWTKLAYGFGSVAYGVKDNGFSYFLLLFYSQVIGVDARLVGVAITIALILDAISDPIVGYWSDNFRSRWGRRHPFMYAAAVPVALTYYLLWDPPAGWSEQALFFYVLSLAILIRTFITFYETPSSAMVAELSDNYDDRSSLLSYRFYFAWTGGNAMSVLMFMAIFPAFAAGTASGGQFNREAYALYGIIAAVLIFAGIMVSALGTHSRIPHLKAPPPKRKLTLGRIFHEIFETLLEPSFIALFVATLFGSIAAGLSAALAFYVLTYFWAFSSLQIGVLTFGVFISAIIGALMAPVVTRTMGKKRGATVIGLIAFIGSPLPMVLKLAGVLPPEPTPFVFWFVVATSVLDVGLIICFQILASSMIADLVEQAELKTGRRAEGIFFGAVTFTRKMVTGLGVMMASFVLAFAGLRAGVDPSQVGQDVTFRLGAVYVPTILSLWLLMMAAISMYRLQRSDHEDNLRRLAERAE